MRVLFVSMIMVLDRATRRGSVIVPKHFLDSFCDVEMRLTIVDIINMLMGYAAA